MIAAGATPVIVDVEPDTLTIDAGACAAAVTTRTRAIVPVHLYGQPADMDAIRRVAEPALARHRRRLLPGAPGDRGRYSRRHARGCGGVQLLSDEEPRRARRRRGGDHRQRRHRGAHSPAAQRRAASNALHHVEAGVNSRLDDLQAAVLARAAAAAGAVDGSAPRAGGAAIGSCCRHRCARSASGTPARVPSVPGAGARTRRAAGASAAAGIETLIHYPVALTEQPAFAAFASRECPVAVAAAGELLSLPLSPRLTDDDVVRVADEVAAFAKGHRLA